MNKLLKKSFISFSNFSNQSLGRIYVRKYLKDSALNPSLFHKTRRRLHGNPGGVQDNSDKDIEALKIIRKVFPFLWPTGKRCIRRRVIFALLLLISAKILNIVIPYVFKLIIDTMTEMKKVTELQWKDVFTSSVLILVVSYGIARFGASFFNELKNSVFAKVSQGSIRHVSNDSFKFMQELDLSFHLNRKTGMVSKSIDRGTRAISFILTALAFNLIPTAFEIVMVTSFMGYHFGLPFVYTTLGCVSFYGSFTYLITRWRTKYRVIMNQADNECGSRVVDSFINYETVKYFNNEEFERKEYDKILKRYEDASLKTISSLSLLNFGQGAIFTSGLVAIMLLAVNGIFVDSMTIGDLVLVNGLIFQLSIPLNFLGSTYRDIRQSLIDLQSLINLLDTKHNIKNMPSSESLIWKPNVSIGEPLIKFENVSFSYENHQVFNGLSFTIPYGKKIAIVGGSGSGKSTIVRLLYRFFDPDEGSISIFDQDIRSVTLESLRNKISVVPQDQVLFHNTIFYNIHYGNITASIDDVIRVSKISGLHDSILKFPNGYETQVGERGLKLSGGEKQRVAIARAVLKNSPILVYDEATSSLDSITEKKILRTFSKILSERTSIVIAHRLSTIIDADEILVLQDGKLVERGRHLDLIINSPLGHYAQLWQKQNELPDEPSTIQKQNINDIDELYNDIGCPKEGCCSK